MQKRFSGVRLIPLQINGYLHSPHTNVFTHYRYAQSFFPHPTDTVVQPHVQHNCKILDSRLFMNIMRQTCKARDAIPYEAPFEKSCECLWVYMYFQFTFSVTHTHTHTPGVENVAVQVLYREVTALSSTLSFHRCRSR